MTHPDRNLVAVKTGVADYPEEPPFHPCGELPECPFSERAAAPNRVYDGLRDTFRLLGLDAEHLGTPAWNPLGCVVVPGDLVVLKPNLVRHWNGAEDHVTALVTHASVVRALLDYVLVALKGRGEVVVGDAPVQETDFAALVEMTGLRRTVDWVAARSGGVKVTLVDWRKERARVMPGGVVLDREPLDGDPRGFLEVDLGRRSFLAPLGEGHRRFRVTNYDRGAMARVHNADHNRYLVSGTVMQADVVITVPKMKCHGKAGITCTLKNNVGINGHKDWLPHHREGSAEEGGDEYRHRSLRKRMLAALADRADRVGSRAVKRALYLTGQAIRRTGRLVPCRDPYTEGSWHGNDTVWRMCLDLNRVLLFMDREGRLHDSRQRRWFALVDGVVAGEGDGPLHVTSKPAGLLVAGFNPVPVDLACGHLMGFDYRLVPLLRHALDHGEPELYSGGLEDIRVVSDLAAYGRLFDLPRSATCAFEPPPGWKGHVELA